MATAEIKVVRRQEASLRVTCPLDQYQTPPATGELLLRQAYHFFRSAIRSRFTRLMPMRIP